MDPGIITNPDLGLTESVRDADGKQVVDNRTTHAKLPYIHPETNLPEDDAHRINHTIQKVDAHMRAVFLASLIDIPFYLLNPNEIS